MTDTQPIPHVKISLEIIYAEVVALRAEVAKLNALEPDVRDHETRIRGLEKWVWRAAGVAAAIGAVGGTALNEMLGRVGQ